MTRVLLVDDSAAVRTGLVLLLESTPDLTVVGTCEDGTGVVAAVAELAPDVVLMDLAMPRMDGLAATAALLAAYPACRVLVLTSSTSGSAVHRAKAAGAIGYLAKSAPPDELFGALRAVAAGRSAWSASAGEALRHEP